MDVKNVASRFDQAVSSLSPPLRGLLLRIPDSAKASAFEIRLRVGRPAVLSCPGQHWFVDERSNLVNSPHMPYIVSQSELNDSIISMCAWSIHAHQHEFRNGFISLRGGHRAGICGTAVVGENGLTSLRDITSVNLRIAREAFGCADEIVQKLFCGRVCGVLIMGIPSSGKTTLLRDLARQLASGETGRYLKVAVVDERCELGAVFEGEPQNDLGVCSDILSAYPKAEGIMTAVRTLSPQVIVCDEIGGGPEADGILEGLNAGVKVVATVHAGSAQELLRRPQMMRLLKSGAFEKIVRLGGADKPGEIREIMEVGELLAQDRRDSSDRSMLFDDGHSRGVRAVEACFAP